MIGTVISGCAIGGLVYISKIFSNSNSVTINDSIPKETWEDIWCHNNVFIEIDKENISIPSLISTERIKNGIRYLFQIPLGITSKDLLCCNTQIKELSNALDVNISHHNKDVVCIDVMTKSDIEIFEGSIDNEKWNNLWTELDLNSKTNSFGYKCPTLISETSITGGTSYIFQMPVGKSSHHVIKYSGTIREFLESKQIEILPIDKNRVEIKSYHEDLPKLVPFELIPRSSKDSFEIPTGKFIDGYAILDFRKVANVLDVGMQGSGKSVATKSALTYCGCMYSPEELNIYISDLKKTELNRFKDMKHVVKYTDTPKGTKAMIKELISVMNERYTLFTKLRVSDIYEYNEKHPQSKMPYIFVAIDEISRYTQYVTKETMLNLYGNNRYSETKMDDGNQLLSELLFLARAAGISVWCSVQRPTKENLNTDVKSSLGNILAFKTADANNSKIVCGNEEKLQYLKGRGNGFFISEGIDKEFQGFYIDNDEIDKILKEKNLLKDKNEYVSPNLLIEEDDCDISDL